VQVALVYNDALDAYDLGENHPLRPERVSGTIALLGELGMLDEDVVMVPPRAATDEELLRVHSPGYLHAVRNAGPTAGLEAFAHGFDGPDSPVFPHMHEASALVAGAGIVATRVVLDGTFTRSFSIAGGLHHAHRDRTAGFCVYNDVAVAIADALAHQPDLRIAYIDIDAHHGDGVQEAF